MSQVCANTENQVCQAQQQLIVLRHMLPVLPPIPNLLCLHHLSSKQHYSVLCLVYAPPLAPLLMQHWMLQMLANQTNHSVSRGAP